MFLPRWGGLEIAGLVGFLLAAAEKRVTVLLDGFIVSVAALLAAQLNPDVREIVHFRAPFRGERPPSSAEASQASLHSRSESATG